MDEKTSKSQKKREATALQELGLLLVALNASKLDQLPLSDPLLKAILDAKSMKSHGAQRRQAQLIGKLMRTADFQAIIAAYGAMMDKQGASHAQEKSVLSHLRSLIQ